MSDSAGPNSAGRNSAGPNSAGPNSAGRTDKARIAPVKPVGKGPAKRFIINLARYSVLFFSWTIVSGWVWLHGRLQMPRWLGSDSREAAVRLWTIAWLTFVWVLLWGTLSWANIIGGIVLAVAIGLLLPLPRVPVEGRIHPLTVLLLITRLIIDFFVSSAEVAWVAIRPGKPPLGAVMRVRVAIKSDMVLTLAVDYLNMVPGTMVLEIDHRRRILYVHVFDVRSDRKVRQFYKQVAFVEKMFIKAFERDSEWHPSPYHGIDDEFHAVRPADRAAAVTGTRTPSTADTPTGTQPGPHVNRDGGTGDGGTGDGGTGDGTDGNSGHDGRQR